MKEYFTEKTAQEDFRTLKQSISKLLNGIMTGVINFFQCVILLFLFILFLIVTIFDGIGTAVSMFIKSDKYIKISVLIIIAGIIAVYYLARHLYY